MKIQTALKSWLLAPVILALTAAAHAADCKIRVDLAWGTDGSKPDGKDLVELDPKARERLRHFRWKNYWVVKSDVQTIDEKAFQKFTLGRCIVELKKTADGQVEVRLHSINDKNETKLVKKVFHSLDALKKGEFVIIAGDDKEKWDDAWFVIIRTEK